MHELFDTVLDSEITYRTIQILLILACGFALVFTAILAVQTYQVGVATNQLLEQLRATYSP